MIGAGSVLCTTHLESSGTLENFFSIKVTLNHNQVWTNENKKTAANNGLLSMLPLKQPALKANARRHGSKPTVGFNVGEV